MRVFDTNVQLIKYHVLKEVAKVAFDDSPLDIIKIPKKIVKGPKPIGRCCIYKERAIISKRIEYIVEGRIENSKSVKVLDIACDECPIGGYSVTEACRGCLAHRCKDACPKNAIRIINQRAVIDKEKCIGCGLCKKACPYGAIIELQRPCQTACNVGAILIDENQKAIIDEEKCISCGACVYRCPFGAIVDESQILKAVDLLKHEKSVYAIIAPSIASQFTYASIGQVVSGLKKLGFHDVVETALGADLTIEEEGEEFEEKDFMMSSCCPAFTDYVNKYFKDLSCYLSATKSPMIKVANLIKEIDKKAKVIFIGPCIAKKEEGKREDGVECVITFEELQALLDARGIKIEEMSEEKLDNASYYARNFAKSGGVAKALLHVTKKKDVKTLSVSGIDNIKLALLKKRAGKLEADFIEGMACEGGCIGGPACLHHGKTDKIDIEKYAKTAKEKTVNESLRVFRDL